ncbi:claudin-10 [Channa argus]|uniref:claudin-10 n=1 Tax=Channa argus TaxID=215402 RepID=UPI003520E870
MKIRVVQIWGFLMTVLGWIFVACTMAMDGWMSSAIGGMGGSSIVKVIWYWSSLWRTCLTDSTSINKCYDFPVLWSVEGHLQVVRGLLIAALSVGMLGFVLSLIGMECTFIGGKDRSKYRKIYAGGWLHVISGLLSTCGYAVYVQYVLQYYNPDPVGLEYELGIPVFLGWVGSAFHMTGGFFYMWSVCKPLCGGEDEKIKRQPVRDPEKNESITALSSAPVIPSKSKVSSVSELSSKSVSSISSRSGNTYKAGRAAKSEHYSSKSRRTTRSAGSSSGSGSSSESSHSSRSSGSTLSKSKSSSMRRTGSSLSGSAKTETPFVKTSYI